MSIGKDNFRRLTEQDLGKAFIREVPRKDSECFGYHSVLQSMGSNLGHDPLISFWTFDIDQNHVIGKHVVSDFARTNFSEAGLPESIVKQGVEACATGHEPRFGMDVEDSWKLFGNAKLGIKGLLQEMEEQTRETGK